MRAFSFALNPPRHPVLRAMLALAGLALLGFFAAFGVVIAALVLAVFGARRLLMHLRKGARPPDPTAARNTDPNVIEGEYAVVRKVQGTLLPR